MLYIATVFEELVSQNTDFGICMILHFRCFILDSLIVFFLSRLKHFSINRFKSVLFSTSTLSG